MSSVFVLVADLAVLAGFLWFARWALNRMLRDVAELLDVERERAYAAGRADGWEMHDQWSQVTANNYADVQGRMHEN